MTDDATGEWTITVGINVFLSKSGSMTKAKIPQFCIDFFAKMPPGKNPLLSFRGSTGNIVNGMELMK